jgi:aromatic ring hydroxylase-like protein
MDEAVANHSVLSNHLWQHGIDDPSETGAGIRREIGERIRTAKLREFRALGMVLGHRYANSPIVVCDGDVPPPGDPIDYQPCSNPGCLAPHAWLTDGRSLYDLFGSGFTLLASRDADEATVRNASAVARTLALPLSQIKVGEPEVAESYRARYTLIRPDQHIAWRGDTWPEDATALLAQISGRTRQQKRSRRIS